MKNLMIAALTVICTFLNLQQISAIDDYKDQNLPLETRVNDLISKMTLAEKIQQLGHKSPAISRLGVAQYNYWNEAIHGVARAGLATSFPVSIALSSTWNPELIYQVATAISDEARVKNNTEKKGLVYWCPTVNMARDPRWGRSEENYGEDVYLASRIAVNFIKGMQGDDPNYLKTVSTAKHFAANNVEANRYGTSSNIDERSLREYYLPVFKACVTEAKVYSVMSAYNAVNGVPSPANRTLLTNILRNEWGFKGFVVSDCDAIGNVWDSHLYVKTGADASAITIRNGNDLNCGSTIQENATAAIESGILSETSIDKALKAIFKARFLLGEFDTPSAVPYTSIPANKLDCQEHRNLALKAAHETIVLLKNEANFLPLNKDSIKTIALLGPNANAVQLGGYSGAPSIYESALKGIAKKLGIDISIGKVEAENFSSQNGIRVEASTDDDGGNNIGYIQNGDDIQYDSINFEAGKSKLDIRVASGTAGGVIDIYLDSKDGRQIGQINVPTTGDWQNWQTQSYDIDSINGIHSIYMKFSGGSGYLLNVNWFRFYNEGDLDPTSGSGPLRYATGCLMSGAKNSAEFNKAVEMARTSDVAVVVVGTDLSIADESHDRSTINLPGYQEELIKEVYKVNPKTVVVLVTGGSLAVGWAQENVPAMLCAWYNGQSQGEAIADVLFGTYNPGGKLSTTWYKSTSDLPAMSDYDISNNRTYMYFNGEPLYPFGYGLSYTNFTYQNLKVGSSTLAAGDSVSVSVDITNSGSVAGDEVVQLYAHANSVLTRPIKELKAFKRITLQPNETQTVTFYVKHNSLAYYNELTKTFDVESGNVDLLIGSSSEEIKLQSTITTLAGTVSETYRQDPFVTFEAEDFENKSKTVSLTSDNNSGLSVNMVGNNSYILIHNFDFNKAALQFNASIASITSGNQLTIVLDNLNGEVAGTLAIESTGDLNSYLTQTTSVNSISGVRDVFLVLKGASNAECNINNFVFGDKPTSINSVEMDANQGYKLNLFSNPTSDLISFSYNIPQDNAVTVEIASILGVVLYSKSLGVQSRGEHLHEISAKAENISTGAYLLTVKTGSYSKTVLLSITA